MSLSPIPSRIHVYVHTCPQRAHQLSRLTDSLDASDVGEYEVRVCEAKGLFQVEHWYLEQFDELCRQHEWVLRLEDDVVVSPHLRHNLEHWPARRDPYFAVGSAFRFSCYQDDWTEWRVDAQTGSLYTVQRLIAGGQALLIRSEKWAEVRKHLPRLPGSMMDLGLSDAVFRADLRYYMHRPSLVQTSEVSRDQCLHSSSQREHYTTNFNPRFKRPENEIQDSNVLSWTGGRVTRFLPTASGDAVPVLVHPEKRGLDYADSIGRRIICKHDKLVDCRYEALQIAKRRRAG